MENGYRILDRASRQQPASVSRMLKSNLCVPIVFGADFGHRRELLGDGSGRHHRFVPILMPLSIRGTTVKAGALANLTVTSMNSI